MWSISPLSFPILVNFAFCFSVSGKPHWRFICFTGLLNKPAFCVCHFSIAFLFSTAWISTTVMFAFLSLLADSSAPLFLDSQAGS